MALDFEQLRDMRAANPAGIGRALAERRRRDVIAGDGRLFIVAADHPAPIGVGGSSIVDPRGVTVATLGADAGVAVAWLDPEEIAAAREQNPALRLRKYTVRASD